MGTTRFISYASKRWNNLSEDYELYLVEVEEKWAADRPTESDSEMEDAQISAMLETEMAGWKLRSALDDVQVALDGLFCINPAIISMRQSYKLSIEVPAVSGTPQASIISIPRSDSISSTPVWSRHSTHSPRSEKKVTAGHDPHISMDQRTQRFLVEESTRLMGLLETASQSDGAAAARSTDVEEKTYIGSFSPLAKQHRLRLEKFQESGRSIPSEKVPAVLDLKQTLQKVVDAVVLPRDMGGLEAQSLLKAESSEDYNDVINRALTEIGSNMSILT